MTLKTTEKQRETTRAEKPRGTRPVAAIPRFCRRAKLPLETFTRQRSRTAGGPSVRSQYRPRPTIWVVWGVFRLDLCRDWCCGFVVSTS